MNFVKRQRTNKNEFFFITWILWANDMKCPHVMRHWRWKLNSHLRSLFTKVTSNYHFIVHYWFGSEPSLGCNSFPLLSIWYHFAVTYFPLFLLLYMLNAFFFSFILALSSVRVVLKSKWMMIIKSPICLIVFVTHFVSKYGSKEYWVTYHTYITFIAVFLRIFDISIGFLCKGQSGYSISVCQSFAYRHFYWRYWSAVVFVFIVWMRVQVFIMRKNEMKNVFNVQTVEPNEQHILKCVLYENEKEICWKKTDP